MSDATPTVRIIDELSRVVKLRSPRTTPRHLYAQLSSRVSGRLLPARINVITVSRRLRRSSRSSSELTADMVSKVDSRFQVMRGSSLSTTLALLFGYLGTQYQRGERQREEQDAETRQQDVAKYRHNRLQNVPGNGRLRPPPAVVRKLSDRPSVRSGHVFTCGLSAPAKGSELNGASPHH